MPTQLYYMDSASFNTATALYLNQSLTVCAPDGYYSNGVSVRQQVACKLLPAVPCGSCLPPCGTPFVGQGARGIYRAQFDTGNTIGAIAIRFNPQFIPDGIRVVLGTTIYNKVSSPTSAPAIIGRAATGTNYTITGNLGDAGCFPTGPFTYNTFNIVNGVTVPDGTESYTIDPADIFLTLPSPGFVTLVVPKTSLSQTVLTIEALGPCANTAWNIVVPCPVVLTRYLRSSRATSSSAACALPANQNYYFVSVQTPVNNAVIGIGDFAFTDSSGLNALADGFYRVNNAGTFEGIEVLRGCVVARFDCL